MTHDLSHMTSLEVHSAEGTSHTRKQIDHSQHYITKPPQFSTINRKKREELFHKFNKQKDDVGLLQKMHNYKSAGDENQGRIFHTGQITRSCSLRKNQYSMRE